MAENRWRAATVNGLCAEAKLHKRYFYESFADLDAVAVAVIDDVASGVDRAAVSAFEATADAPLTAQVRAVVEAVVQSIGRDRRRALVLLGGAAWSPSVHAKRTSAMQRFTDTFVAYTRTGDGTLRRESPLQSTMVAFIIGGTAQAILSWIADGQRTDSAKFVDDVTAMWLSIGR